MTHIITVGGGKGGTGKSTVAVNVSVLLSEKGYRVLLVDADVESPVDHMFLGGSRKRVKDVISFLPRITNEKCIKCNVCVQTCPEHALIGLPNSVPKLLEHLCNGCKKCFYMCPVKAIEEEKRVIGTIYRLSNYGIDLIQGEVLSGVREHINVSLKVLDYAQQFFDSYDFVIIDTSPGSGANVYVALRYAHLSIAVTEPTPLGVSDLMKFLELVEKFNIPFIVTINKADLEGGKTKLIYDAVGSNGVFVEIPYDENLMKAYIRNQPIVIFNRKARSAKALEKLANLTCEYIKP